MYYSCKFLQSGTIEFSYKGINMCNQNVHIGGGNISCATFDDSCPEKFEFDFEKYIATKKEIYSKFVIGEYYSSCEGCIDLYRTSLAPTLHFKLRNFILHYWTQCNSNCIYCYTNKDKKYFNTRKKYKLLPILQELDKKRMIEYQGIANFAGGEISCLDEYNDILKIFRKYDYFIFFNSSAVKYEKSVEEGLSNQNAILIVSVDAGTEKKFKEIKQVDTYRKVWKNLEKYVKRAGSPDSVFLKYIFIKNINCDDKEIILFLEKAKSIGVKNVIFDIDWNWLKNINENIDENFSKLFYFSFKQTQKLNMNMFIYDNASFLFSNGKYKDDFWISYNFANNSVADANYEKILCFSKDQKVKKYANLRSASYDTGIEYKKIKIACKLMKNKIPVICEGKLYMYLKDYKIGIEKILTSRFAWLYSLLYMFI